MWLILAGRGYGKTRTGAETVRIWKDTNKRIGIIAPTYADARDTCIEGVSGLKQICAPGELVKWNRSIGEGEFSNGSQFKVFSSEEPDRLRGPQHNKLWCDEAGSWKYPRETWDMAMFGLRLGDNPQAIVTTTPRPIELVRGLLAAPHTVVTRGSTHDNRDNLAPGFFSEIITRYEGTRLGRQEIYAELLEDVPGALFSRAVIDAGRVLAAPSLVRVVVAVDPAATSRDTSDECGIVTAGAVSEKHGYILSDNTLRGTPSQWAREAIAAYYRVGANCIVAEANNGGEMIETVIHGIDSGVPVKLVYASKSKQARAEPASMLYEQGKVHHVGTLAALEDEMCSWLPLSGKSPNRIDALVWALHELGLSAYKKVGF